MQWLAHISVRRSVFAAVLMILVLVVGAAGYTRLGLDEYPNIDIPLVVILTPLPGAAAEEVESDITNKIEGAVNTLGGVAELRSVSQEGLSQVIVNFVLERDGDAAAQDVRDKVSSVLSELPAGIEPPVISKFDVGASPILLLAVRTNLPIREATELTDKQIRRQLENINGVGQVSLVGGQAREVQVWLDPVALRARGLTPPDVMRALAAQNVTMPGGSLDTGPQSLALRIAGRVNTLEDLGRIVLREIDGHPVRLNDVARVEDGAEQEVSYAQLDRDRTIVLSVRKQSGKNTVVVVDTVKERLAEIEKKLPEGTRLEIIRDNSAVVRTGIHAVQEHLIVGALLAALTVLIFLANVKSTIITVLSIPISIVGTFGVMWFAGVTLNFLTLLALALAVGIVIDDAIVVLENIVRFIDEKGLKPFPAAILATKEIGLAVLATTLSLMAVFVPVAFMDGIVGRFLKEFGLTMAFSIGVSLIVSFTITPALCARWLPGPSAKGAPGHGHSPNNVLSRIVELMYRPIEKGYMSVLRWSMAHRWVIVLMCVLSLGSCAPLASTLPKGFLPSDDRGQFEVNLRTPEGSSLQATRLITERVADDIRSLPGVVQTLLTVGENSSGSNSSKVYVFLTDPRERSLEQLDIMALAREKVLAKLPPEVKATAGEVNSFSGGGSTANIQFAVSGPDLDKLAEHAKRISEELKKVPGAVDVDSTLVIGKPEIQAVIDRERAADLGVLVADVANSLQLFVDGAKATTFAEKGESYDVRIRADASFRANPAMLALVSVPSSKHGTVPLSSLVSMKTDTGPARIEHLDRQRQVTLLANNAPGFGEDTIITELQRIIADQHLGDEYSVTPLGRAKESGKAASGFLLVFALAFLAMYLVLAAQFDSWLHPITILLTLPLTVPFAFLSLHIFNQTLNLFSGLGLLVLFGVVKKNAILQIDHTNHLRSLGMPRLEAILQANKDRLRPILMTTLAFVAGMVPLVTSRGIGAGQNQTTGALVLGGQSLSLLLTLLAVPIAYSFFDDITERIRLWRGAVADKGEHEIDGIIGVDGLADHVAQVNVNPVEYRSSLSSIAPQSASFPPPPPSFRRLPRQDFASSFGSIFDEKTTNSPTQPRGPNDLG
jgi:hydrophobic/amphiphilic exporter-1 (mainly G- bacteria), HAE1 family